MRSRFLLFFGLLISACEEKTASEDSSKVEHHRMMTEVFRTPDDPTEVIRVLWQKSYPEEHKALTKQVEYSKNDPFANAPLDFPPPQDVTPAPFMLGWGRAIVPRTFEELGYPLEGGAEAYYDQTESRLTITHSMEALSAFQRRFPEFEPTNTYKSQP